MIEKKRPGRKSKGERTFVGFRLNRKAAASVEIIREAEGYRYTSDWLADLVSERLSRPDVDAMLSGAATDPRPSAQETNTEQD